MMMESILFYLSQSILYLSIDPASPGCSRAIQIIPTASLDPERFHPWIRYNSQPGPVHSL